jgi:hypothetical protein
MDQKQKVFGKLQLRCVPMKYQLFQTLLEKLVRWDKQVLKEIKVRLEIKVQLEQQEHKVFRD